MSRSQRTAIQRIVRVNLADPRVGHWRLAGRISCQKSFLLFNVNKFFLVTVINNEMLTFDE